MTLYGDSTSWKEAVKKGAKRRASEPRRTANEEELAEARVMTVLTRAEALRLQRYVRGLDENAFITYVTTAEITGRGFRWV